MMVSCGSFKFKIPMCVCVYTHLNTKNHGAHHLDSIFGHPEHLDHAFDSFQHLDAKTSECTP